jgi:two-component system, OmpR family, alkaline phosphatase synthesis response regulator PhoP
MHLASDRASVQILLISDDRLEAETLTRTLTKAGHHVQMFPPGKRALEWARNEAPGLMVVCLNGNRHNVENYCRRLQKNLGALPLVLVPPLDSRPPLLLNRTLVLERPYTAREFTDRVRKALATRGTRAVIIGEIKLDLDSQQAWKGNRLLRLTPRALRLLETLAANAGEVMSRKKLIQQVWNTDYIGDTRVLDVHICWLRQQIEDLPARPQYIRTVRGVGYRLDAP